MSGFLPLWPQFHSNHPMHHQLVEETQVSTWRRTVLCLWISWYPGWILPTEKSARRKRLFEVRFSTKEWQGLAKSMQGKHHVFWKVYELCPTYSYCNNYIRMIIFVNISHLCSVCYFKDLFPSGSCMLDRADRCFHCLDGRWIVAGHLRDVWTLQLSVDMLMLSCSTMQSATIP